MQAEYEVIIHKLKFHPDLSGCFSLAQVAERLRKEFRSWTVLETPQTVGLYRPGQSKPVFSIKRIEVNSLSPVS